VFSTGRSPWCGGLSYNNYQQRRKLTEGWRRVRPATVLRRAGGRHREPGIALDLAFTSSADVLAEMQPSSRSRPPEYGSGAARAWPPR
jgi:hypothetical protein